MIYSALNKPETLHSYKPLIWTTSKAGCLQKVQQLILAYC